MKIIFKHLKGKELNNTQLSVINKIRKEYFNSKTNVNPSPDNDDRNKDYFLLEDDKNNLLAFGRLHDVSINFQGKNYKIYGIATIASIIKNKGYGKILMQGILKFLKINERTGIGFCKNDISDFYRKCGFSILKAKGDNFLYKNSNGELETNEMKNTDVIIFNGKDNLQKILEQDNLKVLISRPHW